MNLRGSFFFFLNKMAASAVNDTLIPPRRENLTPEPSKSGQTIGARREHFFQEVLEETYGFENGDLS